MDKKYKKICLGKDDNGKRIIVDEHRYIMEQHLGRKLKKDEVVHHIDGDKSNNNIYNLEVLMRNEHSRNHRLNKKLSKETKNKISKSNLGRKGARAIKVKMVTQDGIIVKIFNSMLEASIFLIDNNLTKCKKTTARYHISEVCQGKRKSFAKYKWFYY